MSAKSLQAVKDEEKRQKGYANEWAFRHTYNNNLPEIPCGPFLISSTENNSTPDYLYKYTKNEIYDSENIPIDRESFGSTSLKSKDGTILGTDFLIEQYENLKLGTKNTKINSINKSIRPIPVKDEVFLQRPRQPGSKYNAQNGKSILFLKNKTLQMGDVKLFGRSTSNESSDVVVDKRRQNSIINEEDYLSLVEKTFTDANSIDIKTIKHPRDSSLKATEIIPIVPNMGIWDNKYTLASFDADPLLRIEEEVANDQKEEENVTSDGYIQHNEALLKKSLDAETGNEIYGYFTLKEENITRFRDEQENKEAFGEDFEDDEEDEDGNRKPYDYDFIRDYEYRSIEKDHGKRLVLVFDEDENKQKPIAAIKTIDNAYLFKRKIVLKEVNVRRKIRLYDDKGDLIAEEVKDEEAELENKDEPENQGDDEKKESNDSSE